MSKTELLFFIRKSGNTWNIISENQHYGPFLSYMDAFHDAVEEAQAAGIYGFASAVLVQSSIGRPFEAQWIFGLNPYPPAGPYPKRSSDHTEAVFQVPEARREDAARFGPGEADSPTAVTGSSALPYAVTPERIAAACRTRP